MRNIWGNVKTWNVANPKETSLTKRKDKQEGGSYQNVKILIC